MELLSIIDPTARQNALTSGDIDAMDRVDLKTVNLFRETRFYIWDATGTAHYTFPMRLVWHRSTIMILEWRLSGLSSVRN